MSDLASVTGKKPRKVLISALCFTFIGLILVFAVFITTVNKSIHNVSKRQLYEIAQQTASAINIKLNKQQSLISSLAISVSRGDNDIHSVQTLALIKEITEKSDLETIRVTKPNGESFFTPDNVINISNQDFFLAAMNGESGISDTVSSKYVQDENEQILIIYMPIMREGKIIGTIHGECKLKSIMEIINLNAFGGNGYANVFNKEGRFIFNSQNNDIVMQNENDWWKYFSSANIDESDSIDKFKADVKDSKCNSIDFEFDNVKQRGIYTPIGMNHWYLFQVIPRAIITDFTSSVIKLTAILMITVIALLAILMSAIIYVGRLTSRKIIDTNRELGISNEMLNIAFSHVSGTVFTYDMKSDKISFENTETLPFGMRCAQINPDYLIAKQLLTEETVGTFKSMIDRIKEGEKEVSGEVKSRFKDEDHWYQIYLTNVFDDNNLPVRAIGTVEDITIRVLAQMQYLQEEKYRYAMLADSRRVYEIDLSKDLFRKLDSSSYGLNNNEWVSYSAQMIRLSEEIVMPEDKKVFLKIAQREKLLNAFENGLTELMCEYRTINSEGKIFWNESTTHLLSDPLTGDLMCFTYASDITDKKNKESELKFKAERDPLTGLYNRDTAHKLITKILANSDSKALHAFMSVDVDNFKTINDSFGHIQGDSVLNAVSREFEHILRADDILVRMGGDEFAIFLSNITDVLHVKELAKRICSRMHSVKLESGEKIKISVSIGVALYPSHGVTFDELYNHSDIALYVAKRKGRDQYAIYFPDETKII